MVNLYWLGLFDCACNNSGNETFICNLSETFKMNKALAKQLTINIKERKRRFEVILASL